jgi:hypothetical protein
MLRKILEDMSVESLLRLYRQALGYDNTSYADIVCQAVEDEIGQRSYEEIAEGTRKDAEANNQDHARHGAFETRAACDTSH